MQFKPYLVIWLRPNQFQINSKSIPNQLKHCFVWYEFQFSLLIDRKHDSLQSQKVDNKWTIDVSIFRFNWSHYFAIYCHAFVAHLSHICHTFVAHLSHICHTFVTHLSHIHYLWFETIEVLIEVFSAFYIKTTFIWLAFPETTIILTLNKRKPLVMIRTTLTILCI